MVPLVEKGDASGLYREQGTLQPNTQRKQGLNCPEINKQSISLGDPKDRIGLVCIAQENLPEADLNWLRYLTGEEQHDYPRPNCCGNRHKKYLGNRVRALRTNFGITQNCCSRNNSFAQNVGRYLTNGVPGRILEEHKTRILVTCQA